jgi:hypothetical protein
MHPTTPHSTLAYITSAKAMTNHKQPSDNDQNSRAAQTQQGTVLKVDTAHFAIRLIDAPSCSFRMGPVTSISSSVILANVGVGLAIDVLVSDLKFDVENFP